ncbi:Processive diacylglycerol beta-glucosyltransferase [subsurface metagenome]
MRKKKIIFAMLEAGGGHKMPALAVLESIKRLYPGKYDVQIMDFMKELGATEVDTKLKNSWKYMLYHPVLTKGIQAAASVIINSVTRSFIHWGFRAFLLKHFYEHLLSYLQKEKPDLIFSTHYFNSFAVSHVRGKYNIDVLLINYLTEIFDLNSYWFLKDLDHYIVASEEAKEKILRMHFPEEKLKIFPYPIRKEFFVISRTTEEIASDLGIDTSKKILLITLGGEGIGALEKFIVALLKRDFPLNIIPLGFVDNINELIFISDFCFIKPGPATTWEVISFKKPIVFFRSAQLSEVGNIKFVCRNNIGFSAGNQPKKFIRILDSFLNGPALEECRANYSKLNIENGSDAIASFLDELLTNL